MIRSVARLAGFLIICLVTVGPAAAAERLNGFDLSTLTVDRDLVERGGPPRDGIPSIDDPAFVAAAAADAWLADDDRVLGLVVDGHARAYPVRILNWHEIVNDEIGGEPVLVTWCPLCGSGVVYDPRVGDHDTALEFGVSGLLYKSDVLLYDRSTESLFSQLAREAVAGPLAGARLEALPVRLTRWSAWRAAHPDTQVLARPRTADGRLRADYDRNPYEGYVLDRRVMFPVGAQDRRFHPKEEVFGLELAGEAVAWPLSELARMRTPFRATVGGEAVRIHHDAESDSAWATTPAGEELAGQQLFWFAWYAFHPDTDVRLAAAED